MYRMREGKTMVTDDDIVALTKKTDLFLLECLDEYPIDSLSLSGLILARLTMVAHMTNQEMMMAQMLDLAKSKLIIGMTDEAIHKMMH